MYSFLSFLSSIKYETNKGNRAYFNICGPGLNKLSRKEGVDSVEEIRNLRVQSKIKSWFDIDVLNAKGNSDKCFIKVKQSVKEIRKDHFKYEQLLLIFFNGATSNRFLYVNM